MFLCAVLYGHIINNVSSILSTIHTNNRKNLEEARREIEGTVRLQIEDQPNNGAPQSKSTGQISYKDKLNMAKAKRSANSAGAVVTPPPPPVVKVVDQPKPVVEQQPKPVAKVMEQPKVEQTKAGSCKSGGTTKD